MQVERGYDDDLSDSYSSGERVSNAWVTCPKVRNNSGKLELIPHNIYISHDKYIKGVIRLWMDPRLIS
jgi:hypothetical protein